MTGPAGRLGVEASYPEQKDPMADARTVKRRCTARKPGPVVEHGAQHNRYDLLLLRAGQSHIFKRGQLVEERGRRKGTGCTADWRV